MTLSRVVAGAVFAVFIAASGCSSSTASTPTQPQDQGIDPGQAGTVTPPDSQGTDVNPYGDPYPTANLGYQARAGSRAGSIMRNYKFYGYVDGNPANGKTVISLADLYDPDMKQYKLIHFSAGALWCPPCNQEADALVPAIPDLKSRKIVVIQALIEGDVRGKGATLTDLDTWQKRHNVNYTLFLDPEQSNLGQFFEAAAIPWNAILDARSMEILESGVGYNQDMDADYKKWSTWIHSNPAQGAQ
jgi:thiol-disulfide isomerase/thioredoxin